jgi:hypothetical protein
VDRLSDALKLARTLLLGHKEPCDLALDVHGDEHRTWLGGGLNAGSDVWRVAEHLSGRLHDHRPRLHADPSRQLMGVLGRVPGVEVGKSALDCERGPHRALGVILLRMRIAEEGHQPVAEPLQHMPAKSRHCA